MNAERQTIRVGRISIVRDTYEVDVGGKRQSLTAGEYQLLWMLARHEGEVVPMEKLAVSFDRRTEAPSAKTVRARVVAVRRKLGAAAPQLQNVRGSGYRLISAEGR